MKLFLITGLIAILYATCTPLNNYEKRVAIANHKWSKDFVPQFDFDNTNEATSKRLYIIVRHTNNYPYTNIHVKLNIKFPNDSAKTFEKEIFLTKGDQNKSWANKGMDDIYEIKYPIGPFKGPKGKYKISIENIMRDNPLPEIMDIGLAIENLTQ